jgi:hypothetical protein
VLLCRLAPARAPIELAEAEMTVGDEWAQAQLAGQGDGGIVVPFGARRVGPGCGDLGEEAGA